jgi:transcriptional regulator with XRE-family HTH domain
MWEGCRRLDRLLKRQHISSTDLAKTLGVAQATVSRYRSGERAPDPNTLAAICRAVGVSADYLLGLTEYDPAAADELRREIARLYEVATRERGGAS